MNKNSTHSGAWGLAEIMITVPRPGHALSGAWLRRCV